MRIEKKFTIGSRVKGKIRNMTAYGAFVELEEGIDGMIHVSDLSWDPPRSIIQAKFLRKATNSTR